MSNQENNAKNSEQEDSLSNNPDVSIVLPCLNEEQSLPVCLPRAREALEELEKSGLSGELVLADNGSTDGSQEIARSFGARVVDVDRKGYGAALIGGLQAAKGRFLVMGDADGSYDFVESVPMVLALNEGADICMGSRFKGTIKEGAMPWKNRYIGNPVLTGILKFFFRTKISDAHCGLRALTKSCFNDLKLSSTGMEFASEMVIKAALLNKKMEEVPITLSPDARDREPHLRPWRDGWRHLVYLFMLSPFWLFLVPGILSALVGFIILLIATLGMLAPEQSVRIFGDHWAVISGALIGLGHQACLFGLASHIYGVNSGYRHYKPIFLLSWLRLETMLLSGVLLMASGFVVISSVAAYWTASDFKQINYVIPLVVGVSLLVVGAQNVFGGFLLSIISGNKATFLEDSK